MSSCVGNQPKFEYRMLNRLTFVVLPILGLSKHWSMIAASLPPSTINVGEVKTIQLPIAMFDRAVVCK